MAVNLFYGDPLLQIENTIHYLRELEKAKHTGPVIIITKGDFSKFPDVPFDLDLHIAFSTFGIDSYLDGNTMARFKKNLEETRKRKNNYKYSIEFRPIVYGVNDSPEVFAEVLSLAKHYGLAIGYSGLQGKPESVKIWKEQGIDLKPYPGYQFGHKKIIASDVVKRFEELAHSLQVPIFRKTSCLFTYVHGLERDYNAHYYRPSELGCASCVMKDKCFSFKEHLREDAKFDEVIPFAYEILTKDRHECILKKQGVCEFPTEDCSRISGKIIKIDKPITTSDVRVIKWLTGMTVDANFFESPYISEDWVKNPSLIRRKYENRNRH